MPPRSRATAFDKLAPDQRAAVELVLRQGHSYGELAELLGMPEETIRSRARRGLEGLAPDLPAPTRAGEIADWLLGQQAERHAARTRELLLSDPAAHAWATTVATSLRAIPGGESVPQLPTGTADEPEPSVNGKTARARSPRREKRAGDAAAAPAAAAPAGDAAADVPVPPRPDAASTSRGDAAPPDVTAAPDEAPRRIPAVPLGGSSRLGGAILIGAAVVLVGAVLGFVFLRGDDSTPAAETDTSPAAATATASAAPAAAGNDILLRGPAGSKAVGLMRLFQANDGTVRFALAAQGVAPNKSGETYSVWFSKKNGSSRLLGDVKDPVGDKGELASAGPGNDDVDEFPQWLVTYDNVLITRDDEGAKKPGTVILSGTLPRSG